MSTLQRFPSFARGREVRGLGPNPVIELPTQLGPNAWILGYLPCRLPAIKSAHPDALPRRSLFRLPQISGRSDISDHPEVPYRGCQFGVLSEQLHREQVFGAPIPKFEERDVSQPRYPLQGGTHCPDLASCRPSVSRSS